jgi:hypothetical protein
MSEKTIRAILRDICDELDQHARRVMTTGVRKIVLPSLLGAGVALSGGAALSGCGNDSDPIKQDSTVLPRADAAYGMPIRDMNKGERILSTMDSIYGSPLYDRGKGERVLPGPDAAYGVPDAITKIDGGATSLYSAPDAK